MTNIVTDIVLSEGVVLVLLLAVWPVVEIRRRYWERRLDRAKLALAAAKRDAAALERLRLSRAVLAEFDLSYNPNHARSEASDA